MADFPATAKALQLPPIESGGDISPEVWMYQYETYGEKGAFCSDLAKLRALWRGKANRDWWFKEIGRVEWSAAFIPEEFMSMLIPVCFIDLFGREPITELVREYYDNRYRAFDYRIDTWIKKKTGPESRMRYFARDDREHWVKVLWIMFRIRYADPLRWKAKMLWRRYF